MPAIIDRILTWVALGCWPPVPNELRADYVQMPSAEQDQYRRRYATRHLRWGRIISGIAVAMVIKWAWECGFLVFMGLGSGFAQAGDIQRLEAQQYAQRMEVARFEKRDERNRLEDRIRGIDAERFQLDVAIQVSQREGRRPDTLHLQRINVLKVEREAAVKELDLLNAELRQIQKQIDKLTTPQMKATPSDTD